MADLKSREVAKPDRILDEEDETTLAAIDRGIKAADEGRVVSSEAARRRFRERLTRSSSPKTRSET